MPTVVLCHVIEVKFGVWYYAAGSNAVGPFNSNLDAIRHMERMVDARIDLLTIPNDQFRWNEAWSEIIGNAKVPIPE